MVDQSEVLLFSFVIIFSFFALFAFAIISYRLQRRKRCICPYTKKPMWSGEFVPLSSVEKVMKFLYYDVHSYDNRVFPMRTAMICPATRRIFPNIVHWWGVEKIDWTFINKRYPGAYVSWGSLSPDQQRDIKEEHDSLEGFQTERSSSNPLPKDVEPKYVYLRPGPLYVDIETKVLIGWKHVPETSFEVLIVQKPKKRVSIS